MVKRKRITSKGKRSHADIPHEVLLQILLKLPVKTLMRFCCVSKLWLESIVKDTRFINDHFVESQKNPKLIFKFLPKNLDVIEDRGNFLSRKEEYRMSHLFYLEKDKFVNGKSKVLTNIQNLIFSENSSPRKLIGHCNGLTCFMVGAPNNIGDSSYFVIEIFNFSKLEKLRIVSRIQNQRISWVQNCLFGYDILGKVYKLVCIINYYDGASVDKFYYRCIILTLGSTNGAQSWRVSKHPMKHKGCPLDHKYLPPGHCINGAFFWMSMLDIGVLYSFDLHEERFQVIKLPHESDHTDYDNQLEYKGCFCCATIFERFYTHSGMVELHILKDRIKQIWVKENIIFDLPETIRDPPPTSLYRDYGCTATFSLTKEGITSIRMVEFGGRLYLYWRKSEQHKRRSQNFQFYDLELKKLVEVKGDIAGEYGYDYHVANHVENLVSLKAWAMNEGDEGGVLVGRDKFDGCSIGKIQDMFKQMPPSDGAAISFFSSLSFSLENNEVLVV